MHIKKIKKASKRNEEQCFRIKQLKRIFPKRISRNRLQQQDQLQQQQDYPLPLEQQQLTINQVIVAPKHLRTKGTRRTDEIRLNYAKLGMIPEIGGHQQHKTDTRNGKKYKRDRCPFCNKRRLGRSGETMHHIAEKCKNEELKELLTDDNGEKVELIKDLWQRPLVAMETLRKVVGAAKLKNNNSNSFSIFECTPFISFSFNKNFKNKNIKNNDNSKTKNNTFSFSNNNNKNQTSTFSSFSSLLYSSSKQTNFSNNYSFSIISSSSSTSFCTTSFSNKNNKNTTTKSTKPSSFTRHSHNKETNIDDQNSQLRESTSESLFVSEEK